MKTNTKFFAVALIFQYVVCNLQLKAQSVGINSTGVAPNASALLDVDAAPANNKGLLLPRLSTIERNAIVSPAQSLLIYNTTDSCYQGYIGTQWVSFGCVGSSTSPTPPIATCGTQVFTSVNLDVGTMINSTSTGFPHFEQTNNGTVEKYCYNNVVANCAIYGGLYEWNEAMQYNASINCDPCGSGGVQGICPVGFHVPTDLEWSRYEWCVENTIIPTGSTPLVTFQINVNGRGSTVAGIGSGSKMKVTPGNTPTWDGTNTSGFSGLSAGLRNPTGDFVTLNAITFFWSSTERPTMIVEAWDRRLFTGLNESVRGMHDKENGHSIRCLQN